MLSCEVTKASRGFDGSRQTDACSLPLRENDVKLPRVICGRILPWRGKVIEPAIFGDANWEIPRNVRETGLVIARRS